MFMNFMKRCCFVTAASLAATSCASISHTTAPSSSPPQEVAYLNQDVFCEVLPSEVLTRELSFRAKHFIFSHRSDPVNSFACEIIGSRLSDPKDSTLRVDYVANGKLSRASGGGSFESVRKAGRTSLEISGVEGEGYIWIDKGYVRSVWLYPTGYVLDVSLRGNGFMYTEDEAAIRGIRRVAETIVSAVPPIAAESGQEFISSDD